MSLRIPGPRINLGDYRRKSEGETKLQGLENYAFTTDEEENGSKLSKEHVTVFAKTESFPCNEFEELLEMVGSEGKLQKKLLYCFILPFVAILPFFLLGLIFMIYEPNHWCHVPGKDPGMDEETWKNLTIPRKTGTTGTDEEFSKCTMYVLNRNSSTSECLYGWDYDRSDYKETLPSYLNWVCTKSHYATGVLTAAAIGSCVGTPIYGWAGDKIGRKLVFFITIIVNILFRGISLFIPEYFSAFLATQFIVGTTFPMMYIVPFTLLAEICSNDYRSWIYASAWMIWVIGICILPLLSWLLADWFLIGIATWVPGIFIFLYWNMIPESPRWLLTVGLVDEATVIMKNIAQENGTAGKFKEGQIEGMLKALLEKQQNGNEETPQVWDLFRRKRLAIYTLLLGVVWSINGLVYYGITLNSTSMAGNQFLNFFYLSVIELPAGWLGRVLVEKVGRRWSQALFFIFCAIGFAIAAYGIINNLMILVIIAVVISKFSVAYTSLVVNLQANEIFPTQLRSTGIGFVGTFSALIQIAAPTIIYLRKFHEGAPYLVMGIVAILGVISSAFIPETLRQSLPETNEDSNNLGKDTKFWSYLPEDYKISEQNRIKTSKNVK